MTKLSSEGLVVSSNLSTEEPDPPRIQFLSRFRQGNHYTAIPFLLQHSLACYNRERLHKAPVSFAELLSCAVEGLALLLRFGGDSTSNATMERSLEASIVPNFRQGIGLRTRMEPLRHLLKQDVYGEQPPEKVLQGIEALANATP